MILGVDEALRAPVADTARRFYESTLDYWQEWVRYLSIPFEWQEAVIRAAITLKLCNFEETGGVVAAATTSIPEAPDSGRNWDYRLCWLRDAYFVVHALNRLGATRTLEGYSAYITNIVAASDGKPLQPVYGVSLENRLHERIIDSLTGYNGMGPVRAGNAAYAQAQHDVYGSVILACTQLFFDQRIMRPGTREHFDRLERLGRLAAEYYDKPDAGLWEYRGRARVHTFSSIMCWAACDRLAKIARRLGLPEHMRAMVAEKPRKSARSSSTAPGSRNKTPSSRVLTVRISMPASCSCTIWASSRPTTRVSSARSRRSSRVCAAAPI